MDTTLLQDETGGTISTTTKTTTKTNTTNINSTLTPTEIMAALQGKTKDEVVPFLLEMDVPTELKVDLALQHFSSQL